MTQPLPNTYWVVPDRLLAGEHPATQSEAETRDRLECLRLAGVNYFIDLTEVDEMPPYQHLLPPGSEYLRFPIVDASTPGDRAALRQLLTTLQAALDSGKRPYVHCRAGIGRTGLVIGCYLTETGVSGHAALKRLNRLWRASERSKTWPRVPQTAQQSEYVKRWPDQPDKSVKKGTFLQRLFRS